MEKEMKDEAGRSCANPIATVNFDLNGGKKIMLNYAKLRIVDSAAE